MYSIFMSYKCCLSWSSLVMYLTECWHAQDRVQHCIKRSKVWPGHSMWWCFDWVYNIQGPSIPLLEVTHLLSFKIIFYCSYSIYFQYPFLLGLVVALLWTALVACSRVYLGMHTALVSGHWRNTKLHILAAIFFLLCWRPVNEPSPIENNYIFSLFPT